MISIVIKGPSYQEAAIQIQRATSVGQLVELRLDYFHVIDQLELAKLQKQFSIPMIFTLRSTAEGGMYSGSDETQLEILQKLIPLRPDYIDIEARFGKDKIGMLSSLSPDIKWIVSSHCNLEIEEFSTIPNLILKKVKAINSSFEALEFLELNRKFASRGIFIGLGRSGLPTRVLAPVFQAPFTYAALSEQEKVTPEQPIAEDLQNKYRLSALNNKTELFGLLGFPVEQSLSDWTHNKLMHHLNLNAIYLKYPLQKEEIAPFLNKAKTLGFKGFSVTMPLKEHIVEHLDIKDENVLKIGAANTLQIVNGMIKGSNTDGIGALNAIEKHVSSRGLKILIIGAGGAAKAIAYESISRGANVTIISRNPTKTAVAFQKLGCSIASLEEMDHQEYDLLINATPDPCPIEERAIKPEKFAMDLKTRPKETLFLQKAKEKNNQIIHGYEMFVEQAVEQFSIWFQGLDRDDARDKLYDYALTLFK